MTAFYESHFRHCEVGIFKKNRISRLTADRMEAEVTLFEEQDETEKIREDIRRMEAQIQTLRGAQFG